MFITHLRRNNKSLAKLQEALSGKTLVGEYVGHQNLGHIVRYQRETIVFYAITDNNEKEHTCILPEKAYQLFNEFGFD